MNKSEKHIFLFLSFEYDLECDQERTYFLLRKIVQS